MLTLAKFQEGFVKLILEEQISSSLQNQIEQEIIPFHRILIHKSSAYASLIKLLKDIFPIVHSAIGGDKFANLMPTYIKTYAPPPPSGSLFNYSEHISLFIEKSSIINEFPYLGDIARIERVKHLARCGEQVSAIDAQELSSVPPEKMGNIQFAFNPYTFFLST